MLSRIPYQSASLSKAKYRTNHAFLDDVTCVMLRKGRHVLEISIYRVTIVSGRIFYCYVDLETETSLPIGILNKGMTKQ
jgi:hypothetical protein